MLSPQISTLEADKIATTEATNKSFFELREKLSSAQIESDHVRGELQAAILAKDAMFNELSQNLAVAESKVEEIEMEKVEKVKEVEGSLEERERVNEELEERVAALAQEVEAFQVSGILVIINSYELIKFI